MRVCVLSSGSRGNCVYIEGGDSAILIDNGLAFKELKNRLDVAGLDLSKIKATLVTHEHTDHVKGVGVMSRSMNTEVFCCNDCYNAFEHKVGKFNYAGNNPNYENGFTAHGFDIKPFRTPHDAVYSVGYRVSFEGKTVALATDLGTITPGVYSHLTGTDLTIIESNHDVEMLKNGTYPMSLKARILGSNGHLSNKDMAAVINDLTLSGTDKFVLAHLSEDNNNPDIAYNEADAALHRLGASRGDIELVVAGQYIPTKVFNI